MRLKDINALRKELKNDYITKKLSAAASSLALRCGRLLTVANAVRITIKHMDFKAAEQHAEQSSETEELLANFAH